MSLAVLAAAVALASSDGSAAAARALNLAVMRAPPPARRHEEDLVLRSAGLARTSVDTALDKGATGSVGFLCGRPGGQADQGGAAAYGYDPNGRFVGAKLSIGF